MIVSSIQSNSLNKNIYLKKQNEIAFSGNSNGRKSDANVKAGAVLGTVLGVSSVLAILMKKQGHSLRPSSKLLKGLWKAKFTEKEIMAMAGGSIAGGLAGGAITDKKENLHAKFRETVIQVGNVSVPLLFVSLGAKFLNKNKDKISEYIPKIKSEKVTVKFLNRALKASPMVATTAACLFAGVYCANKIGNFINEKIFNIKGKRRMKAADFSPHLDDVCVGVSLMANKNIVGNIISRFIPVALTVPGISIGTAQEKGNLHHRRYQTYPNKIVKS